MKKEQAANGGRASENGGNEELLKILRDIVTFHGEMVLLENYSSLNYTGKLLTSLKDSKISLQVCILIAKCICLVCILGDWCEGIVDTRVTLILVCTIED